jgi:hypothetical protein
VQFFHDRGRIIEKVDIEYLGIHTQVNRRS